MIPAMLDAHFSLLNYAFYSKNYHPIIIENEEGITDIGLKYVNNEMCYPAILNKKEEKMRKNFKILDKNRSFQKKRQEIEKYNRMQKCLMSKKRICGKI